VRVCIFILFYCYTTLPEHLFTFEEDEDADVVNILSVLHYVKNHCLFMISLVIRRR